MVSPRFGHGTLGANGGKGKTVVLGMKERGGEIVTKVVQTRRGAELLPIIRDTVKPHSEVHTDEHTGYGALGVMNGYWHKRVNHSAGEYHTMAGVGVNGIESFWAQLKRSIHGTHIHVSQKHLSKYLGEFEFRHNRRHRPATMLSELLTAFQR